MQFLVYNSYSSSHQRKLLNKFGIKGGSIKINIKGDPSKKHLKAPSITCTIERMKFKGQSRSQSRFSRNRTKKRLRRRASTEIKIN